MRNIFTKMLLIFLIPAIGMLFFTGTFVQEKISILDEIDIEKKSIEYLRVSEKLLNELQKERGLSAGFLASNTGQFKEQLLAQRQETNKALNLYKNYISNIQTENSRLNELIKKVQTKLFTINAIRLDIDQLKIDVTDDIKRYTDINLKIIDSIAMLLSNPLSQNRFKDINSLYSLISIKDFAGIERAILTDVFVEGSINDETKEYVKNIIEIQEKNIHKFLSETSIDNTTLYYEIVDLNVISTVDTYRDIILEGQTDDIKKVRADIWWIASSNKLELYGKLVQRISDNTMIYAQEALVSAKRALIFSLIIWIVGIIGFIVSIMLLGNIVRLERKNYKSLTKQKHLYNVLTKTNEHIIHDYDMDEVFNNICDIAVEEVDLSLAFIGMLDPYQNIKVVASSGDKELQEYLLRLNISIKNEKNSRLGLAGRAIVEARNIIVDNIKNDKTSLLTDVAKRYELNSAGAYPLVQSNTIVGVMVVYSKDVKFFDKDITELFERMTGYLSFGLEKEVEKRLAKLYEEELRISAYAFDSQEAMVITDKDANIIKVNNAFTKITGYTKNEVFGHNPRILKSDYHSGAFFKRMWRDLEKNGRWGGELYNRHKDGTICPLKTTITAIKDKNNNTTHFIAQFYDISDIKQSEQKLTYQARHDALTGLPNRIVLKDRLSQAIKSSKRHKKIGALMFIDLDNFKYINDTLGHDIGDELLKQIAKILSSCVREEDSVIRFGGDEFLILTSNLSKDFDEAKELASKIARKVRKSIDKPLIVKGHELFTTPSIGITFFPSYSTNTNDVIKQADIAMYKAKDAGKNSIQFFTP